MHWIDRPLRVDDTVTVARGGIKSDISVAEIRSAPPRYRRITDTAYTLQLEDAGVFLVFTSAESVTLTVPIDFAGDTKILQAGDGAISFVADGAGSIENVAGETDSAGQWALLNLASVPALEGVFILTGDTA